MYQLFYDGDKPAVLPNLPKRKASDQIAWGSSGKDADFLSRFRRVLGKTKEADKKMLMFMAQKMAGSGRVAS